MTDDVSVPTGAGDVVRAVEPESAQLMNAIVRAASDERVSPEKMTALYELHIKMQDRASRLEFSAALARAQAAFPVIDRKGRIVVYSKTDREKAGGPRPEDRPQQVTSYALWEDVNEAIIPALTTEGFSLAFETESLPDNRIIIRGILSHRDGYSKSAQTPPMQHDSSGSKNAVQAVMSTISYGKRMAAGLLVNFTSRGEDNDGGDGAKIESPEKINDMQYEELSSEIARQGGNAKEQFIARFGSPRDLPASRYQEAVDRLKARAARTKDKAIVP